MSNKVAVPTQISAHELALVQNDLSKLNAQERLSLYNKTCDSLGLNPITQPFGYIEFRGGKLSLYAKKDATDQLRKIHGVSVEIVSKEVVNDNYVVIARAKDAQGRVDEDMGSVTIKNLSGETLGNAMMKAITKAKRRVTLSICGLGMLDETETESIKDAKIVNDNNKELGEGQNADPTPKQNIDTNELKTVNPPQAPPKPIITHAPTTETPTVDTYKTRFAIFKWPMGTTFAELGVHGTKELQTSLQAYVLKSTSGGSVVNPQILEFLELSKEYLARFE